CCRTPTHALTTLVLFASIGFLASTRWLKARFPTARALQLVIPELVALSTLLCGVFRWDKLGLDILRDVEGGLMAPRLPAEPASKVRYYLLSAVLISVIGFVESIAVAKTYATKYNYSMSPNRELVAIGAANVFGSVFGGWPAFGSLGRSAVNDASGARTQVAGFVTGVIILVTIVALLPLFYFLPKAVCSAIIVVAATKLIELHDVVFILKLRAWNDLGLLLLTFLSTLLVSIEVGTLISVGTSLLLVVQHTTKTRIAILGRTYVVDPASGNVKVKFRSISDKAEVERIEGSLVIRVEEGLYFGNTGQLTERLNRVGMYGELGVHPGEEPHVKASAAEAGPGGKEEHLSNSNTKTPLAGCTDRRGAILAKPPAAGAGECGRVGSCDPRQQVVVDAIVQQLDRAGAARAARVSRSWAAAARPVVFAKVCLSGPSPYPTTHASNQQSTTIDKFDDPVDAGDLMLESPLTLVKELRFYRVSPKEAASFARMVQRAGARPTRLDLMDMEVTEEVSAAFEPVVGGVEAGIVSSDVHAGRGTFPVPLAPEEFVGSAL
ncbi:Solute carrier 26, partial [Cladochytrium tenue]